MDLNVPQDPSQDRRAPWPAAEDLPRTAKLRKRLADLPDAVSGISLAPFKDTALPAWADDGPAAPADDEKWSCEQMLALAPPADAPDERIAAALSAARALLGRGKADGAVELLLAAARAVRTRKEGTFFALWLLEVAERWASGGSPKRLRCQVKAQLGGLLAQVGDLGEGIQLLRNASGGLRLARQADDHDALTAEAWRLQYEAAAFASRTDPNLRKDAIAQLRIVRDGVPKYGETWFRASFELIAAEAGPKKAAASAVEGGQLLRRLSESGLPAADQKRLEAHGRRALGLALAFGKNRFLHTRSREESQAAAVLFKDIGDWTNLAQTLDALGRICSQLGDHAAADAALQRSIELKGPLKDLWGLGAYFNARAEGLLRRGRPLEAVPWFDANLDLIAQTQDDRDASATLRLLLQNMGEKVLAYLASYQNPLEAEERKPAQSDLDNAATVLKKYYELMDGQPDVERSKAHHLMYRGTLARLQARLPDAKDSPALLADGEELTNDAIRTFKAQGDVVALPNAEIQLAGLRIERARLTDDSAARLLLLDGARQALEAAERHIWDSYERAYLELEWACYCRAVGQAARAEYHVTAARYHAGACGNQSIPTGTDSPMGVQLRGPTGEDRWEVILPPGRQLDLPILARDWRGRPLAGCTLHAFMASRHDSEVSGPAEAPVTLVASEAVTDVLGRARFTVMAREGAAEPEPVRLEVRHHGVLREARVEIHVQPFVIDLDPSLPADLRPEKDDEVVLRHLFGPRFRRVVIRKQFGGLGGATVLLVEPFLASPQGMGKTPSDDDDGMKAQHCLVKIGDRREIVEEASCYDKHVKDLLSPNVSRIAGKAVWGDRAGMRMSLAGDQEWDRARDETEWLSEAPLVDAHHLLVDMFARDLGPCWYANEPDPKEEMKRYQIYGRQMPVLLTLREPGPDEGLLHEAPADRDRLTRITEGLLPPGEGGLEKGKKVYLGELKIVSWKRRDGKDEWEYKLASAANGGLRVALRTLVPPQYVDPDGLEDNLVGQRRHVVGVVEQFAFDRLSDVLKACAAGYPRDAPGDEIVVADDGATLKTLAAGEAPLHNPLPHMHDLLELSLSHRRSIIHGDLHTRNVIVNPRGMPYYIDFSEAGVGPTLFDFIKHEVALWDWTLADPPRAARCTLTDAIALMRELTDPGNRFPAPFASPRCLKGKKDGAETARLTKFYQCVGTLRSLARQHSTTPDKAPDYFGPLCLYAGLVLRWCDPREKNDPEDKATEARRGVFLAVLSGMLWSRGLTGLAAPGPG